MAGKPKNSSGKSRFKIRKKKRNSAETAGTADTAGRKHAFLHPCGEPGNYQSQVDAMPQIRGTMVPFRRKNLASLSRNIREAVDSAIDNGELHTTEIGGWLHVSLEELTAFVASLQVKGGRR